MGGQIDWDSVRARLAAAEATLGRDELTDEQREAIFARRAAALAVPAGDDAPGDALEVLVFPLGTERYAFPTDQVHGVRALDRLTALPGVPAFVAGLINERGRVVPVLDLRALFGLTSSGEAGVTVVLLPGRRGDTGVLAHSRPAIRRLSAGELTPLPAGGPRGPDPAWVRGVTRDLVVVLDAERLLEDSRLLVDDETA